MLAIFDIDGTICDTQEVEGRCFAQAFEDVCGFPLKTLDWTQYDEPTSSGIFRSMLAGDPELEEKEGFFKARFLELLVEERPNYPGDFMPIAGAPEFIKLLSSRVGTTVAFATGAFDTEAAFKLRCCGIDLAAYPHGTSSDLPARKDIITLAASRSGVDLSSAVYFGDGSWDVKVSKELEVPMIGIGRKFEMLRELGADYVFRDFSQEREVIEVLNSYSDRGNEKPAR